MVDSADRSPDDVAEAEQEAEQTERASTAARLFDVRRVIGGLFVVYGLVVGLVGLFDSPAEIAKAQGVRINLWAGTGMLALGLFFLLWQWLRPAEAPSASPPSDQETTAPAASAAAEQPNRD